MAEKGSRWKLYALVVFILFVSVFFLRDTYWQTSLSEQEFLALYVGVIRLQYRLADKPEEAKKQTKAFLQRAGVTEEEVNRFIEQVNKKPEKWAEVWEKINTELDKDTMLPKNR